MPEIEVQEELTISQQLKISKQPKRQLDTKALLRESLGELDEIIDEVFKKVVLTGTGRNTPQLNIISWLKGKEWITEENVETIKSFYSKHLDEIQTSLDGKDEELVEGYSFLNPAQKRKVIEFYTTLLSGCEEYILLKKRRKTLSRKVRVPKPVSTSKQIKSLKFLKESEEFNSISIQPELLIGAMSLFVFNTSNKKLTQYTALAGGFKVKGSSLINWDEKLSQSKTLRKPEETLKAITGGGRVQLKKLMASLTTKASTPNGCINSKTILLKVEKNVL